MSNNNNLSSLNKGVVSLIVPCYNSEEYINRCIDSILNQTYRKIELIVVNDGSSDSTEKILRNREKEIKSKLYKYIYIYQKNKGVGAAVNRGLKVFSGEFLALLDSDDYMMTNAIEKKVKWLDENLKYAAVRNNGLYVSEADFWGKGYLFYQTSDNLITEDLFSDIINGYAVNWPGSYMIRSKVWLKRCPNREIYESRYGQNMQILLPATYHEKTGYISEPLMRYNLRKDSLSHYSRDTHGYKAIRNSFEYEKIYIAVVNKICNKSELNEIMSAIDRNFIKQRMNIAINSNNKKLSKKYYSELKDKYVITLDDKINYAKRFHPILAILLRVKRKARKIYRSNFR